MLVRWTIPGFKCPPLSSRTCYLAVKLLLAFFSLFKLVSISFVTSIFPGLPPCSTFYMIHSSFQTLVFTGMLHLIFVTIVFLFSLMLCFFTNFTIWVLHSEKNGTKTVPQMYYLIARKSVPFGVPFWCHFVTIIKEKRVPLCKKGTFFPE